MNSSLFSLLHQMGVNLARKGQFDIALTKFIEALKMRPDDVELHYHTALCYKNLNNPTQFLAHLQAVLNQIPDEPLAHFELANFYKNQRNFKNALHHYHLTLQKAPDFTLGHFSLGLLFLEHNYLKEAKTEFQNVLTLAPGHLKAHFHLGVIAISENDFTHAKNQFKSVLEINKEDIDALTNLGVVALKEDLGQEAIDYFTRALILKNDDEKARSNLAATFMHYDRFDNAIVHYQILLETHPYHEEYLYNLGVAYMTLGQFNPAIEAFEKLIKINPNHVESLTNLAAIALRMGQKEKAKNLFEQAHHLRPKDQLTAFMKNALTHPNTPLEASPEYAKALFDPYALYYDEHMKKVLKYSLPQILETSLHSLSLKKSDLTLDLGCGTGLSGEILRPLSIQLEGVDISPKMLKIAKNKFIYDKLHQQDIITFLKHAKNSYNMIVALDVLPYFSELDSLFNLIAKHLNPEGYFIFSSEISHDAPFKLETTLRFCHQLEYIKGLLLKYTFECIEEKTVAARLNDNKMIEAHYFVVKKPSGVKT